LNKFIEAIQAMPERDIRDAIYPACLSPESLAMNVNGLWQVFWLVLLFNTFPSLIIIRQWYAD
jgi:hypothetical protein